MMSWTYWKLPRQITFKKMKVGKKKPKAKPIREKGPTLKRAKRQPMIPLPAALER
jgi:hypothetical protein